MHTPGTTIELNYSGAIRCLRDGFAYIATNYSIQAARVYAIIFCIKWNNIQMMSAYFKVHFKQIFVMVGKQATWEYWSRKALSIHLNIRIC